MPAVSVILPTYNRAYCLGRAVDSVLTQTFRDFELIVVDDGSTDETQELLAGYTDPRLRVIRQPENKGQSAARNAGILAANGKYIAFHDSDDEWLPEKLERQVEVLDSAPPDVGVVFCDHWRFRNGERTYYPAPNIQPEDGLVFERALDDGLKNIGTPTLLMRRACLEKSGLFDENMNRSVDLDLCIRLAKHFRFQRMPEPLMNVYMTGDSITSGGERTGIAAAEAMFEKHYSDYLRNRTLFAKRAYWIGSYHLRNGDVRKGRRFLRMAAWAQPTNLRYLAGLVLGLFGPRFYQSVHRLLKSS